MGDDHPCIMEGVGTIQIKMFDGMIRKLKKVRYVPQLKRNLISVGALEALGLVVSIKEGVLKMTKGSMVVLKAVRRNNLYYLNGSTVTGQVAASTGSDEDLTRLWHIRLGHAVRVGKRWIRLQNSFDWIEDYNRSVFRLQGREDVES